MNLGRHSISSTNPVQLFDARFDADSNIFTTAAQAGFAVYRTYPLQLIRKRGRLASPPVIRPSDFFHRAARWYTYCSSSFACHKHPLSFGWRPQSSLSSKQGCPLERYSGQGSRRTRIQREGEGSGLSPWMACSVFAKESRRFSDWRINDKIRRMGYL